MSTALLEVPEEVQETQEIPEVRPITKVWELFERGGWCQHAIARDREGRCLGAGPGSYDSPLAAQWCVLGGILRVYGRLFPHMAKLEELLGRPIISWNNSPKRTQAEVIAACKHVDL